MPADNAYERVVLTGGRWMIFNQDYLDFLDEYLRTIQVEPTEPSLLETTLTEGDFNCSPGVAQAGGLSDFRCKWRFP